MNGGDGEIICRSCKETFSIAAGSCPYCGTAIRGSVGTFAAMAIGVLIALASLLSIGDLWFFMVLGLVVAGIGYYLHRDKRRRIEEAGTSTS